MGRRRRGEQGLKLLLGNGTRGWLPDPITCNAFLGYPSTFLPRSKSPLDATWWLPNWLLPLSPILGEAISGKLLANSVRTGCILASVRVMSWMEVDDVAPAGVYSNVRSRHLTIPSMAANSGIPRIQ